MILKSDPKSMEFAQRHAFWDSLLFIKIGSATPSVALFKQALC